MNKGQKAAAILSFLYMALFAIDTQMTEYYIPSYVFIAPLVLVMGGIGLFILHRYITLAFAGVGFDWFSLIGVFMAILFAVSMYAYNFM